MNANVTKKENIDINNFPLCEFKKILKIKITQKPIMPMTGFGILKNNLDSCMAIIDLHENKSLISQVVICWGFFNNLKYSRVSLSEDIAPIRENTIIIIVDLQNLIELSIL